MSNRHILVLQHVACEGLGGIAPALAAANLSPRFVRIDEGDPVPPEIGDAAGLIVLGGPMSVYDHETLPHLKDEMRLIESALKAEALVLGVCLGSQLLAHVLGARVYPGRQKEIGWRRVSLTAEAAADPLWSPLPQQFVGFHWHGDVFDLPQGAVPMARSELTPVQAFRSGRNAYGILFHLEVTAPQIAEMCRLFPHEVRQAGVTSAHVAQGNEHHLPELMSYGQSLFGRWAKAV